MGKYPLKAKQMALGREMELVAHQLTVRQVKGRGKLCWCAWKDKTFHKNKQKTPHTKQNNNKTPSTHHRNPSNNQTNREEEFWNCKTASPRSLQYHL